MPAKSKEGTNSLVGRPEPSPKTLIPPRPLAEILADLPPVAFAGSADGCLCR